MARCILRLSLLVLFMPSICGLVASAQDNSPQMSFHRPVAFAVSPPLRELANLPSRPHYGFSEGKPLRPVDFHPGRVPGLGVDPVEQSSPGAPSNISVGLSIPGLAKDFGQTRPDTNAAVGDAQLVEWENVQYAVYNKSNGVLELGPLMGVRCGRAWVARATKITMAT
jgi:hypothetical protein